MEATCPSCGAIPVRALKNGEPTVCLNCGALSRVNESGDGLELCNNPNDIMGESGGLFDALFGGGAGAGGMGGGGMGDFDVMDVMGGGASSTSSMKNDDSAEEKAKKAKRQGTVIDVDVERD